MAEASPVAWKWLFTSEKLDKVPCRQRLSSAEILKKRQTTAELIQSIGMEIDVDQSCINTACVYMHRFYDSKCFCTFNSVTMAKAAIFLAKKQVYTDKRPSYSQVVKVCYYICHPDFPKDSPIPDCKYLKKDLINFVKLLTESQLLLCNVAAIELPDKFIKEFDDRMKFDPFILEQCLRVSTTCIQLTTMYLRYTPDVIGSFCVWLVDKWLGRDVLVSEDPVAVINDSIGTFTAMMNELLESCHENASEIEADIKLWLETDKKKYTAEMSDVSEPQSLKLRIRVQRKSEEE